MASKTRSRQLNLIRAHRKRSALTQDEVGFLLGSQKGSKVSRYEQLTRLPELRTALAFEAIFKRSVSELFPGLFQMVKAAVKERAKVLAKRVFQGKSKSLLAQKRKSVSSIISDEKNKGEKK